MKRKNILPKPPFERLLKKLGAERVSDSALEALTLHVEEKMLEVAKQAVALTKHAGRKTVLVEDILLAKKRVLG
ncbi:MAG TPA: histone family protein [Candidatus Aenigmarchaeota archaeon]|nr:histone family protein [Candidatus Aenigmarchaeota archaeon]